MCTLMKNCSVPELPTQVGEGNCHWSCQAGSYLGLEARHGGCPSSWLGLANDMMGADVGSQHAHISLS